MEIFLASGNRHKQKELAFIFTPHTVLIPADIGFDFDPEENGSTFIENSIIKADALWNMVQKPVIADDSGICVDILNGAPGIFSARYAGKNDPRGEITGDKKEARERNTLLLEETTLAVAAYKKKNPQDTRIEQELRTCRFVCAMVLYTAKGRFYSVQETLEGSLIDSIDFEKGKGGFGYDPVMFLPEYGKTVAELSDAEKNRISHRGKAAKALLQFISQIS